VSPPLPVRHEHGSGHEHANQHRGGGHTHGGVSASVLGSQEALRTLRLSLVILGATALLQLVVVVLSGSVALLADTVHNLGDALTALPLAAAFLLSRRPATARLTYGYGRAEDLAGLAVLVIILFSAAYAAYEAISRLLHPTTPGYLLAVAIAGVIGFVGNEWVAVYRIRTGRRIGSAALVADGQHARIDGFTSLAVVGGAIGVALGFPLADPIVGLVISVVILRIVWSSAKQIGLRILDGIEPEIVQAIRHEAAHVPGVSSVGEVRARWLGHAVWAEVNVAVSGNLSVEVGHQVAVAVWTRLVERVEHLEEVLVHVDPPGAAGEAHHSARLRGYTGHVQPGHAHDGAGAGAG
jgi:cation diffusion facilitator family transporter